jgi:hypothetical protein
MLQHLSHVPVPHYRKYNEKQSQHKTKLRKAKQIFLMATAQRDRTIQKLENDLALASSLSHKVSLSVNQSVRFSVISLVSWFIS